MMIRINLLPNRSVKRRGAGPQVLYALAAALVLTFGANALWWNARTNAAEAAALKVKETKKEIAALEKIIGDVNDINARKKEVESKLRVLEDLRRQRSGPVKMLDALASATPKKVWLKKFEEKNNGVVVAASAMSHEDVSDFMRGLANVVWTPKGIARIVEQKRDSKTSRVEILADGTMEDFPVAQVGPFFTEVDLKRAEQKDQKTEYSSSAIKMVDFELTLKTNYAI